MSNYEKSIDRCKQLMEYNNRPDTKSEYKGIEFSKKGADGKIYAIIREGSKYYIKESEKPNPICEDFDYLGGFRERKKHEYDSYANALKNFDLKMFSIKEAVEADVDANFLVESWNPNRTLEEKSKIVNTISEDIARQRQLMENTTRIMNGQPIEELKSLIAPNADSEGKDMNKDNIKKGKVQSAQPSTNTAKTPKPRVKPTEEKLNEGEALHNSTDYKSNVGTGDAKTKGKIKGTTVVSSANKALHNSTDYKSNVGTGDAKTKGKFNLTEGEEDFTEDDEIVIDGEDKKQITDILHQLADSLESLQDKLGNTSFDDDDLYDDDENGDDDNDGDGEEDVYEIDFDDEDDEGEGDEDSESDGDDEDVYEIDFEDEDGENEDNEDSESDGDEDDDEKEF